jgi:hypothetical protein
MKLELYETKLELRPYEEIIQLLQDELRDKGLPTQTTSSMQNGYYNNEQTRIPTSEGNWTRVLSHQHKKPRYLGRNLT